MNSERPTMVLTAAGGATFSDVVNANGGLAIDTSAFTVEGDADAGRTAWSLTSAVTGGSGLSVVWAGTTAGSAELAMLTLDPGNFTPDSTAAQGIRIKNPAAANAGTATGLLIEGANWDSAISTDGNITLTGSGAIACTGCVGAADMADRTRTVPLNLRSWFNSTQSDDLDWSSAIDIAPDFVNMGGGDGILTIEYDVVGGSVDTDYIAFSFTVPYDYGSAGTLVFLVDQAADTVTNIESIACDAALAGAAYGGEVSTNLANTTNKQTLTVTPTDFATMAAGDLVTVKCRQATAAADDTGQDCARDTTRSQTGLV